MGFKCPSGILDAKRVPLFKTLQINHLSSLQVLITAHTLGYNDPIW